VLTGNQQWQAIIDTGFNGELELPERLPGPTPTMQRAPLSAAIAVHPDTAGINPAAR